MKKLIATAVLSLVVLAGCSGEPQDGRYATLAQCLTDKNVKFYGAFWCPHCQDQKKLFGDDFRYVTYVECDARGENGDPETCRAAGVTRYPTWGFPGQEPVTGVQAPEALAQRANCPLPEDADVSTPEASSDEAASSDPNTAPEEAVDDTSSSDN